MNQKQEQDLRIQALRNLREVPQYKLVVESLKQVKNRLDGMIYNESTDEKLRKECVMKSNLISNFINLPDDLIEGLESGVIQKIEV